MLSVCERRSVVPSVDCLLCDALLDEARRLGVREMYLLTIDAQDFFARFGFEIVERSVAPEAIRNTWEFSVACPDTAFFMQKNL